MNFLITGKVYALMKEQYEDAFTLSLISTLCVTLCYVHPNITTKGKWEKEHWICGYFPSFVVILGLGLFVCFDRVSHSPD